MKSINTQGDLCASFFPFPEWCCSSLSFSCFYVLPFPFPVLVSYHLCSLYFPQKDEDEVSEEAVVLSISHSRQFVYFVLSKWRDREKDVLLLALPPSLPISRPQFFFLSVSSSFPLHPSPSTEKRRYSQNIKSSSQFYGEGGKAHTYLQVGLHTHTIDHTHTNTHSFLFVYFFSFFFWLKGGGGGAVSKRNKNGSTHTIRSTSLPY